MLPEPVRLRVVSLAADRLGALPVDEVPSSLRPHARFTPSRRARLAAGPIATALEADPLFRDRVAEGVREVLPELAAAVDAGSIPPAAAPEDVGALAYLLRPAGWQSMVDDVARTLASAAAAAASAGSALQTARLREQLAAVRAAGRAEAERLRVELASARSEADDLRRRLREATEQVRRAERAAAAARDAAMANQDTAAAAAAAAAAETRRIRSRLAQAEATVEAARRTARGGRSAEDVRLRLLLDTVVEAASGLRRELALPTVTVHPADLFAEAAGLSATVAGSEPARGLAGADPARLDWLLALPQTHLLVDGYNVTKTGYGALPLESQRTRLVSGLAALAAQTGVEVTVVFDGAERPAPVAGPTPRGVRVLFSPAGETADELIRQLVRAEPAGRPLVVVSSDREVADGARLAGARDVPSAALLRRLERG